MRLFLLFFLLTLPSLSLAADGRFYDLDSEQTHIRFASKMCEADLLLGEFGTVTGTLYFDEKNPEQSWVNVSVDAASAVFNKEYHREDHIETIVEGEKFLNTAQFPLITFKSTKVEKTSDITAMVSGDMMLVGQTHPFVMEVTFHDDTGLAADGTRDIVAFSAYGTFKRSDWNILYALDRVGIRRIGDEVQVLISAAATHNPNHTDSP